MQDNLLRRVPILNLQLKKLRDTRKIIASWLKREKKRQFSQLYISRFRLRLLISRSFSSNILNMIVSLQDICSNILRELGTVYMLEDSHANRATPQESTIHMFL